MALRIAISAGRGESMCESVKRSGGGEQTNELDRRVRVARFVPSECVGRRRSRRSCLILLRGLNLTSTVSLHSALFATCIYIHTSQRSVLTSRITELSPQIGTLLESISGGFWINVNHV